MQRWLMIERLANRRKTNEWSHGRTRRPILPPAAMKARTADELLRAPEKENTEEFGIIRPELIEFESGSLPQLRETIGGVLVGELGYDLLSGFKDEAVT